MTTESTADSNGSGLPPLESDHPLLEALREALGEILAETQRQWERERALMEAQAAAVVADMRAAIVTLDGKFERVVTERLSALRDGESGAPGPKGEPGPPGRDGRLRTVTEWSGGVHYEGDLVHHGGSLWQCIKDSGRPPPHEDWVCLARAGRDARTPRVCGTWSPDGQYRALDVCALGGCSFIATKDNPGICPGDGWQALTLPGKRGQQGPPGARGEKGERGPPGQSAPFIVSWIVERASYSVVPILSDGTEGPRLELRPLFEQFNAETAP